MAIEDLMKMKPRELQILIATKVEQVCDVDLPDIKERLTAGDQRFEDHEGRLIKIETTEKVENRLLGNGKRRLTFGGLSVSAVGGIIFGLGKAAGWW